MKNFVQAFTIQKIHKQKLKWYYKIAVHHFGLWFVPVAIHIPTGKFKTGYQ